LVVRIHDILVADQGFTTVGLWGPLSDSFSYPECRGPYTRIIKHLPGPSGTTSDGKGVFSDRIIWDLKPFIGTIAVAPLRPIQSGSDTAMGQGPFGGNLDSRDFCRGNSVFLPVFHEGAYLYVGDLHATMADTELSGLADETAGEVTLSCEIVSAKAIPWPRVETPTDIIQLHSSRPLEDAVRHCFLWLIDWLVEDYGFSPRDAYLQMSVNPEVRVNVYQMVAFGRINFTAGVQIPKKFLC
jgi:acetamidase/formamidase